MFLLVAAAPALLYSILFFCFLSYVLPLQYFSPPFVSISFFPFQLLFRILLSLPHRFTLFNSVSLALLLLSISAVPSCTTPCPLDLFSPPLYPHLSFPSPIPSAALGLSILNQRRERNFDLSRRSFSLWVAWSL